MGSDTILQLIVKLMIFSSQLFAANPGVWLVR